MGIRATFSPSIRLAAAMVLALALVGCATSPASNSGAIREEVLQHETAALHTFKNHDKAALLRLCLPSYYEITADGTINTLQDQLAELDDYVLGAYRMEDVEVTLVSSTVALIRYKISAEYSFRGKKLPIVPVLASAVWILQDGEWRAATYQEVKLPGPVHD